MEDNINQPVNPSEAPIQTVQHPINNQRGNSLIILGVIMLLLVVGGGAYYLGIQKNSCNEVNQNAQQFNPTPTLTFEPSPSTNNQTTNSDWKTYTNTTYKFSLNYPYTLKVSSNGDFAADLIDQNIEQKDITPSNIKVRISVNQSSKNFEKIYSAPNNSVISEEQHALDATFTKVRNRMIGGFKAVDFTYDVPGNQTEKSYTKGTIIDKNGILIEISSWASETTDIEKIVNTFQSLTLCQIV